MAYGPGDPAWEQEVKNLNRMSKHQLRNAYLVELKHSNKQIVFGLEDMSVDELISAILEERKERLSV